MRIRSYLILMAVAILVPVIVFSGMALKMLRETHLDAALQGQHETARSVSLLVDRDLSRAEGSLRVLATSPYLDTGNMAAFYEQAGTANQGKTAWTILLDESGRQVLNTSVPFATKLPPAAAQARVSQVLSTQKTLVSDVIIGLVSKRPLTTLNIPVTTASGKKFVLAMAFSTEHFNNLMMSANVDKNWLVAIIDGQGHFVARSMNKERNIGKPARPELVAAAQKEANGVIRHNTLENIEMYDVFTHSSISKWMVAVAAPVTYVEESVRSAVSLAVFGMLAALICAGIAALIFGGRLAQSINGATSTAALLGSGRKPHFEKTRVSELRELHDALDRASALLTQADLDRSTAESERQLLLVAERKAREEAQAQNAAKDEFLAMLGHELRNPLAPISIAAELLKLPHLTEERIRNSSDIIARQVRHLKSLLDDLLDVSRVTRGDVTLQIGPVEIADVIKEAVEQVSAQIEAKGHRLQIDLPSGSTVVNGDRSRLIQIIVNLLSNASKYSPSSGKIDIQVTLEQDWVNLSILDWGNGIDSAFLPRIFDLFSQGTRSSDRSQGGLGLGLALVKRLVELHGGSVTAFSKGNGRGSQFIVRLPRLSDAQSEGNSAVVAAHFVSSSETATRIVVVDDNQDAANMLALFLTEAGLHDVRTYFDGQSALDNIEQDRPMVYILDVGLPDMDGYELARKIRESAFGSRAKLIALTGYGQSQDRVQAMAAGFDFHLSKPADLTDILDLISKLISGQD